MKRSLLVLVSLLVLSVTLTPARATLTFNVNTTTFEYFFTGHSTGLGGSETLPHDVIQWGSGNLHGLTKMELPANLFMSNHEIDGINIYFGFGTILFEIIALHEGAEKTPITLTGSGLASSYRDFPAGQFDELQVFASDYVALTLHSGSGFDPVQMQELTGVPEPSTWALLGLGAVAMACRLGRRRTA